VTIGGHAGWRERTVGSVQDNRIRAATNVDAGGKRICDLADRAAAGGRQGRHHVARQPHCLQERIGARLGHRDHHDVLTRFERADPVGSAIVGHVAGTHDQLPPAGDSGAAQYTHRRVHERLAVFIHDAAGNRAEFPQRQIGIGAVLVGNQLDRLRRSVGSKTSVRAIGVARFRGRDREPSRRQIAEGELPFWIGHHPQRARPRQRERDNGARHGPRASGFHRPPENDPVAGRDRLVRRVRKPSDRSALVHHNLAVEHRRAGECNGGKRQRGNPQRKLAAYSLGHMLHRA